jgi:cytochrome c oxidase cbb3-type subunit I/II
MATNTVDASVTASKMRAMRSIGVPYDAREIASAAADEAAQAGEIADSLRKDGAEVDPRSEIVALIAYLQRLGVHPQPHPAGGSPVSLAK